MPPKSAIAVRRASDADMPPAIRSSVIMVTQARTSSSSWISTSSLRKRFRSMLWMRDQSFIFPSLGCLQSICHGDGHPRPFFFFNFQLAFARLGDAIKLRAPVIFRFAPEGAQPTCFFHAVKSRKQGTRLDQKCPVGDLLNAA